jgi:hypothetical protein
LSLIEPFQFDRIYGGWWRRNVAAGGSAAVARSADRYLSFALDDIAERHAGHPGDTAR